MYETGILAAFLVWAYTSIMLIVNVHSRFARNLAKIDMRISWLSGEPIPAEVRSGFLWRLFAVLAYLIFGIVGMLLSWLSVAWWVGNMIYQRSKNTGMPPAVKELRWKLRNVDMTREQIEAALQSTGDSLTPAN